MPKNTGRAWELSLEEQHRRYRRDERAWIVKTEPGQNMRGKFTAKGPPDYVGVIGALGGRAVVFDAKACGGVRFPLSAIKPHQAADLEAAYQRGALCFIALRFDADGGVGRVLDWSWLRRWYREWRTGKGPASLPASEIARCPQMGGDLGADWLGVVGG